MRRTIRKKTYIRWICWLVVFISLFLGLYISTRIARCFYPDDNPLPIYRMAFDILENGTLASVVILSVACVSVFCAMIVSAILGAVGILEEEKEYVPVPKSQLKNTKQQHRHTAHP